MNIWPIIRSIACFINTNATSKTIDVDGG